MMSLAQAWGHLSPYRRQTDLCEFQDSQVGKTLSLKRDVRPGSGSQDSRGYTEKPCLENPKINKQINKERGAEPGGGLGKKDLPHYILANLRLRLLLCQCPELWMTDCSWHVVTTGTHCNLFDSKNLLSFCYL